MENPNTSIEWDDEWEQLQDLCGDEWGQSSDEPYIEEIEEDPPEEFALLPHQELHCSRLINTLQIYNGAMDTSMTGCGKTYVSIMIAKILQLSLIIICPLTVISVWKKIAELADVKIILITTYQSLSSKQLIQPKHGFLEKYESEHNYKSYYDFNVTEKYKRALSEGCLLIIDEVQNVRNNTTQYRATKRLVNEVANGDGKSKYILLSATPFDKPLQAINMMMLIGIIKHERLTFRSKPTGWNDLVDFCLEKDPERTYRILNRYFYGKKKVKKLYETCAFILYAEIIRRQLCSAMPLVIDYPCIARNFYCEVSDEDRPNFEKVMKKFKKAVAYVKNPLIVRDGNDSNFGNIVRAMVEIETLKIPYIEKFARLFLEKPKFKVNISVHYLNTVRELTRRLRKYEPLVLTGGVSPKKREKIIEKFQSNEPGCKRLLIHIDTVGGVGISLHDTNGDYSRVQFQSPGPNLILTQQNVGRMYRAGTKSKTYIFIFYVNAGNNERHCHNILIKKSGIMRAIQEENNRNNIPLPTDYAELYEKDDPKLEKLIDSDK